MNERSDINIQPTCDIEAISVCCPLAQLSALSYIDVTVKCSENDPLKTVKALADTGAQISVIKADLISRCAVEVLGKIKLQPFCGDVVETDWIKLQISPFTESECDDNAYITVDCAVVCNSNEEMIVTADVMTRLQQCKQTADISRNVVDVSCCAPITVEDDVNDQSADTDFALVSDDISDITINDNVHSQRDDHNEVNLSDNVGDDKHDDVGNNDQTSSLTDDLSSCQQVAEEQLKDESLKGLSLIHI